MTTIKINYIEFPSNDLPASKAFFETAFAWQFTDYGPDYTAFSNSGIAGGLFRSGQCSRTDNGAALVVLYTEDLEGCLQKVKEAGGEISKDIFSFPGGRRFHFLEPAGNELAVWSDHEGTT